MGSSKLQFEALRKAMMVALESPVNALEWQEKGEIEGGIRAIMRLADSRAPRV